MSTVRKIDGGRGVSTKRAGLRADSRSAEMGDPLVRLMCKPPAVLSASRLCECGLARRQGLASNRSINLHNPYLEEEKLLEALRDRQMCLPQSSSCN